MTRPTTDADSRRGFLRRLAAAAAAVGVGGAARADEADVVGPLRVGDLRIAPHVVGPVVVRGGDYDYLVYDAHRTDRRGRVVRGDMVVGVVRLTRCAAWRIRVDGDQELRGRAADPSTLDPAGTYEVQNSSWVFDVVEDEPALAKGPALHHCVFTFQETHFECVLAGYDVLAYEGSFDDLVDHLTTP